MITVERKVLMIEARYAGQLRTSKGLRYPDADVGDFEDIACGSTST
jgi:hypothetical protein